MDTQIWGIFLNLVGILTIGSYSKTLRYKIITDDDGRREIVPSQTNASPDIIQFLERDLNLTQETASTAPVTELESENETVTNRVANPPPRSYIVSPSHELKMWSPMEGWKATTSPNRPVDQKGKVVEHIDNMHKINPTTKSYLDEYYQNTKKSIISLAENITSKPSALEVTELTGNGKIILHKTHPTTKSYINNKNHAMKNRNANHSESSTSIPEDSTHMQDRVDTIYKMNPTTKSYIDKRYTKKWSATNTDTSTSVPEPNTSAEDVTDSAQTVGSTTLSYIDKRYQQMKKWNTNRNSSSTSIPPEAVLEEDRMDTVHKMNPTTKNYLDNHDQLMQKWNAYTAEGWSRQKNAIYANSTKLVIYDDTPKNSTHLSVDFKQGRSENISYDPYEMIHLDNTDPPENITDVLVEPEYQLKHFEAPAANRSEHSLGNENENLTTDLSIWNLLTRLYDCFENSSRDNGTFSCIQNRVTNLVLTFLGGSFKNVERSSQEKTLLHGKKILKGALLPLLVLLIIKYLVALPVLAAGIVTIKTFWLSLLSAGVASFGAPWKKHVLKRNEPEVAWASSSPPWMAMQRHAKGTEKYFM